MPQLRSATCYIGEAESICIGLLCCDFCCTGIGKTAGQTWPKQSIEGSTWCCGQQLQQDVHCKSTSHQYWNQSNALQFASCPSCCFSSALYSLMLGPALLTVTLGFEHQRKWALCSTSIMIASDTNCQVGIWHDSSLTTHYIPLYWQECPWSSWKKNFGFQGYVWGRTTHGLLARNFGERSWLPLDPQHWCGSPGWSRTMGFESFNSYLLSWICFFPILEDFERHVTPDSTKKQKVGWVYTTYMYCKYILCHSEFLANMSWSLDFAFGPAQKNQQLSEDAATTLFDVVCVWLWVREKMKVEFAEPIIEQHDAKFLKGTLGFC